MPRGDQPQVTRTDHADHGIHDHDVDAVNSSQARALYKKREPVYPKLVHGKYRLIKWVLLVVTLGIYYGLPWLRWDRGEGNPDQAVLVDFDGQRFYFFFIELWPDELYFVSGLLILSALSLFLVTSLFGRLWCGYSCPQTVWTDLFIAVERLIEGDRNKRIKLDKSPWTASKITKKVSKHAIWLLIAAATGGAWILYFHDAPTIARDLFLGQAPMTAYLFLGILTFTTYMLAGTMREQVCIYMCPWPRIQGAMQDNDTFAVGYYAGRGEPRGKLKKGSEEVFGDCIDCKACIAACPMGIDIRDGDQLECINCGLCADACDEIMVKIDRPKGLIAYGSDYRTLQKGEKRRVMPNFFRPRTMLYSSVIFIALAIMAFGLSSRSTVEFNIERNRTPAYTMLSDGSLRNAMTLRLLNKYNTPTDFEVEVQGPDGFIVDAVGVEIEDGRFTLPVAAGSQRNLRLFVTAPAEWRRQAGEPFTVTLKDPVSGETVVRDLKMIGGSR